MDRLSLDVDHRGKSQFAAYYPLCAAELGHDLCHAPKPKSHGPRVFWEERGDVHGSLAAD